MNRSDLAWFIGIGTMGLAGLACWLYGRFVLTPRLRREIQSDHRMSTR